MVSDIGLIAVLLAFACGIYAIITAVYGGRNKREDWVTSARNAALVIAPLLTLAALTIIYSNLTGNFRLEYTAHVSSQATPTVLKITALWGGQNGSLLFWSWLMSMFVAGVMLRKWDKNRDLMPYVIAVAEVTQVFFLILVALFANPFARLWQTPAGEITGAVFGTSALFTTLSHIGFSGIAQTLFAPPGSMPFTPADGQGLSPLLRHPGMVAHPPFLYLGFVGFTIPYSFAMAALITGKTNDAWIRTTRRWTLMAWLLLTIGLLLGARWAYDVLGWGGYWGWDAVENAALMPWISGTAFLHSVMIQEKRGMFKTWNMFLIILTFAQVILGTFITRTGVISSVHSFARSAIGVPFLTFTGVMLVGSVGLLLARLDDLKSENKLDSVLSREAAFIAQNALFLIINLAVAIGTYFPIFSELFTDNKITVGAPYYDSVVGPLLVPLILLMGVAPLVAWRAASPQALGKSALYVPGPITAIALVAIFGLGIHNPFALLGFGLVIYAGVIVVVEYVRGVRARHRAIGEAYPLALWNLVGRNRRRYGGYLVHVGIMLMGVGVIGTHLYQQETQQALTVGQSLSIGGYRVTFRQLELVPSGQPDKQIISARVDVSQGDKFLTTMRPYQEQYTNGERMTPPALLGSMKEDLYVLLGGWESDGSLATFKVFINPLVNWLWLGGLMFIFGTLVAAWPDAAEERRALRVGRGAMMPGIVRAS
jgi:cytochrome c-type biogenesis protein CcmF